jgi:cell division protein FtsZ
VETQNLADNLVTSHAKIKVFGVGGGGSNAVRRMAREGMTGVDFYIVNTDAQSLLYAKNENLTRIQIGAKVTKGLGAGGDPKVGAMAAEESMDELRKAMRGADMVFVAAGMGGGTGTGAAPVLGNIAKENGILTIGIVTKPFGFEGSFRRESAEEGITHLGPACDTLIIIPNDRILHLVDRRTAADKAFKLADEILYQGVDAITSVITGQGEINLDFADIRAVMKGAGPAWLSMGRATGQNRAVEAAKACISSPLLDSSMAGATAILYVFTAGTDITLTEIEEAGQVIRKTADPAANIIFGLTYSPDMSNEIRIVMVATGFSYKPGKANLAAQEGELNELRKAVKNEEQLAVPAFLRNPVQKHRREILTRALKQDNNSGPAYPDLANNVARNNQGWLRDSN